MNAARSGENLRTAYFAGGCFWGVEHLLKKERGVITVEPGYMGGHLADPTYQDVCTGDTGHAETVRVVFDPALTSYEAIARLFFEIHDPTQIDRQGPDVGSQYRSAVFYADEEQKATADRLIDELIRKGYDVVTEVLPAGDFWVAEDYHHNHYDRKGTQPYCHSYVKRF